MASGNVNTKLELARRLLEAPSPTLEPEPGIVVDNTEPDDWQSLLKELTGIDVGICPVCGSTRRYRILIPATPLIIVPACRSP